MLEKQKVATAVASQIGAPVLIWGGPGIGKTSFVNALGRELDVPVETVLASIREPSDFSGLPVITGQGVRLEPPAWAKRLCEAGDGILFLDEISTAPPLVQAALLRVVLDKVVGEETLPPKVKVIAAANPPEEAAGGWDLAPPLANRFVHLHWAADSGAWVQGMLTGWSEPSLPVLSEEWEAHLPEMKALVASFIKSRPHLLYQMPRDESSSGKAWPSPRSWEMGAKLLAACKDAEVDEEIEHLLLNGSVGEGAAIEFMTWRRNLDLPDPEELLSDPSIFTLPDTGDKQYALFSSIVAAVMSNPSKERWEAAWDVLRRGADAGAADIAASSARDLHQARVKARKSYPIPKNALKAFLPVLKASGAI